MMGSYTLLLLLGLGVAFSTAKPLESTTTTPQLTSPKVTETPSTTRGSPIPTIASLIQDHETYPPPAVIFNKHFPIHSGMAMPNPAYFPDQVGMQPWRDSKIPFVPIIPYERFRYEILNDKIVEKQTEQPIADVKDEVTPDDQDNQDMVTMTPTDTPMLQEDESMVQQPKNDKIKQIMKNEGQHHRMIKIPLTMAPIPIVGSRMIPVRMIEPQYTMSPMEMQPEIRYGMPEEFDFSKRIRIDNEDPDEFMMRRRRPENNSELDEAMKPEQEGQVEENDMDMSENEDPDPEMSPEEEPESDQEPELDMKSFQDAAPVLPTDQESEMEPDQQQEMMPQPEQEQEVMPQQEQDPEMSEEPKTEQEEPESISEEQVQNKDELIMTQEQVYPQHDMPQDDGENMVEGYQDIWRGNMDIFRDSPDIPKMVW